MPTTKLSTSKLGQRSLSLSLEGSTTAATSSEDDSSRVVSADVAPPIDGALPTSEDDSSRVNPADVAPSIDRGATEAQVAMAAPTSSEDDSARVNPADVAPSINGANTSGGQDQSWSGDNANTSDGQNQDWSGDNANTSSSSRTPRPQQPRLKPEDFHREALQSKTFFSLDSHLDAQTWPVEPQVENWQERDPSYQPPAFKQLKARDQIDHITVSKAFVDEDGGAYMVDESYSWEDCGVPVEIANALRHDGMLAPWPAQVKMLQATLQNKASLLIGAAFGSGKTAATTAIALSVTLKANPAMRGTMPSVVMMFPTHELCRNHAIALRKLVKDHGIDLKIRSQYGQTPYLETGQPRVDILLAWAGRLYDIHQKAHASFMNVKTFIVDEGVDVFTKLPRLLSEVHEEIKGGEQIMKPANDTEEFYAIYQASWLADLVNPRFVFSGPRVPEQIHDESKAVLLGQSDRELEGFEWQSPVDSTVDARLVFINVNSAVENMNFLRPATTKLTVSALHGSVNGYSQS